MELTFDSSSIGMKIDIIRLNDEKETIYPSQILDIVGPKELIISGPIKKNDLILLHKGENIKVVYSVENKGKHYFTAQIISRKYSSLYTLKVRRISDINYIQLRKYYRLLSTLVVNKEYEISKGDKSEIISEECETKDISGGGMKLLCNNKHEVGDKILCSFKINDSLIKIGGLVVRIDEVDSFNYKYGIGIAFPEIKEDTRDAIIRYIFEQQRILRLKGLI